MENKKMKNNKYIITEKERVEKYNEYTCIECKETHNKAYNCYCAKKCNKDKYGNRINCDFREYVEIKNYYDNLDNAIEFMLYWKCKNCNQIKWENDKRANAKIFYSNYKDDPIRLEIIKLFEKYR